MDTYDFSDLWNSRLAIYTRYALAFIVVLLLIAGTVLFFMFRSQPAFYRELMDVPVESLVEPAAKAEEKSLSLQQEVRHVGKTWKIELSESEINGWLAHTLAKKYTSHIPNGLSNPRIRIDGENLDVAFQVEQSGLRGVVSLTASIEQIEPDLFSLHTKSYRIGALPIPREQVRDIVLQVVRRLRGVQIEELDEKDGIKFSIRLAPPRPGGPKIRIDQLRIQNGSLVFSGETQRSGVGSR